MTRIGLERSRVIWHGRDQRSFGMVWNGLAQSGRICSILERSGAIWKDMQRSGAIGNKPESSGTISTDLERSQLSWSDPERLGRIESHPQRTRAIRSDLEADQSKQGIQQQTRMAWNRTNLQPLEIQQLRMNWSDFEQSSAMQSKLQRGCGQVWSNMCSLG